MKHINIMAFAAAALLLLGGCRQQSASVAPADNIYQFTVADGNGVQVPLADYKGKVLLVVNTATECGFTPQYEDIQALYTRFHGRGLEVLDFPCNQFGAQAPGSNDEIRAFCTGTYNTTFAQMDKVCVNGDSAIALYTWLKGKAPFGGFDTTDPRGAYLDAAFRAQDPDYAANPDIKWNFTKFVVDREGNVVARFEPTDPMSRVAECIEALL
ncbi:MAG: glutathione peroxidase [Bacteroidales bacterium]|nr:glutathione peroxidase [Bacteroidales bacterium]